MMETKLGKLKSFAADENWTAALRIASRFNRLGNQRDAIKRAWDALQNPRFYRQIGIDPDAAVAAGIKALRERYSL